MTSGRKSLDVVMAYVHALDGQRYDEALGLLREDVRVRGPGGETFGKPMDFIGMLRSYRGRYDIKKTFADGDDICLLYELRTSGPTVFMSSWYKVRDGKISSIHSIFDPRAFDAKQKVGPGKASAGLEANGSLHSGLAEERSETL